MYFQVSDEDGKGVVTHATGPRWDTLPKIKGQINETIQAAKALQGEARAALVRQAYSHIRSWCEVFCRAGAVGPGDCALPAQCPDDGIRENQAGSTPGRD